jgi:hypothetical protein
MTLNDLETLFPTEESCKRELVRRRWPDSAIRCPKCGTDKVTTLKTRPFNWLCRACDKRGYRFSVLVGTIFENTNIPLRTWFKAMYHMSVAKKGVSALQLQGMLGLKKYESAWYLCHRIRAAMQNDEFKKLTGVVEIDETYVGGKSKTRHHDKQLEFRSKNKHHPFKGKAGVLGAISRKGNVTARVIERLDSNTVGRFVRDTVSEAVDLVATDDLKLYSDMYWGPLRKHASVNHSKGEYVRGVVHTANLDSFWSLLKRGIVGSYHHVSKKYLPLYVNEFAFRHNHRGDPDIFGALLAGC